MILDGQQKMKLNLIQLEDRNNPASYLHSYAEGIEFNGDTGIGWATGSYTLIEQPLKQEEKVFIMEQLLFGNPEFKEGVNVTVRRGDKWYEKFEDGLREVELATPNGNRVGSGKLVGAIWTEFPFIPQEVLDMEHASNCRTLEDLYINGMVPAYPDFEFCEDVTVLFFTVNKE